MAVRGRSQAVNQAQDVGEQASRDCDFGELEQAHLVVAEAVAGKPCPVDGVLAFLDVLLCRAALIVEGHHPFAWPGRTGDDEEADAGIQTMKKPTRGYN